MELETLWLLLYSITYSYELVSYHIMK